MFESPPNPVRTVVRRSYGRFNDFAFRDCFGRVLDNDCPNLLDRLSSMVEIDLFLDSLRDDIVVALDDHAPLRLFAGRGPSGSLQFLGLELGSEIPYLEERSVLAMAECGLSATNVWKDSGVRRT